MEKNNVICFYHENEVFGCFSNWYPSGFEYAGRTYKSVEQYMMYQKAILFREFEIADEIMNSDDPAHIKKLGRSKMERFDSNLWDKVSYTIVKRGIDAKFTQNPELCSKLIKTGNKLLAEASRNDLKWGIGIDIEDIRCYDTKFWMGKNLLGRALMEVRDELVLADRHSLEYVDAKEIDFAEWNIKAGILERIPKFHNAIHAYSDTLLGSYERDCFYNNGSLALWDLSMKTDMGGGLPAIGFWEMKQDIYNTVRRTMR